MSRYSENMAKFEREADERDWKRRCYLASEELDRQKISELIEEGVENDYDSSVISELEKL